MPSLHDATRGRILFGGDHNPEQWPEEVWPEDARLMREAGVNSVTLGVFSWAKLEPRPGVRDFGWLDRLMDLMHGHGIGVVLATPASAPPPWLGRLHPRRRPATRTGRSSGGARASTSRTPALPTAATPPPSPRTWRPGTRTIPRSRCGTSTTSTAPTTGATRRRARSAAGSGRSTPHSWSATSPSATSSPRTPRVTAEVAVLHDWDSWWAGRQEGRPSSLVDHPEVLRAWHRALREANVPADFAHPEHGLTPYRLVVAPHLCLLTDTAIDNLLSSARAGSTLVCGFLTGVVDGDEWWPPEAQESVGCGEFTGTLWSEELTAAEGRSCWAATGWPSCARTKGHGRGRRDRKEHQPPTTVRNTMGRHSHRTTLTRLLLAPALAAGVAFGLASAPAQAAVWSTCDQWGNTTLDGYTLYNNIWGSGAGSQCVSADSGTQWSVHADHPNTSGIKSYPNSKKVIGKPVDSLSSLRSSYDVTVPSAGDYNSSYDIWDTDHDYEIMLWVNHHGNVGPLGTPEGSVTLGGHTWDVYKGSNGSNEVFSFLRTSDSFSGTVDILPVLKWIKNTKGWMGNETIGDVQFGYEISGSAGGLDFRTRSLTVSGS